VGHEIRMIVQGGMNNFESKLEDGRILRRLRYLKCAGNGLRELQLRYEGKFKEEMNEIVS
jgi:hypothetical protein